MDTAVRALIDRLERLDTPAVSDALDHLGLRGAVIGIRPIWPCPRIAGRVITVKVVPAGLTRPEHHLAAPAVESAEPGDVLVIDNAERTDVSCWGAILSNAAQVKGIRGTIIDGACRDVDGSRDLSYPVYARGGVPVTARGRVIQESYNTLIQVGGVQVRPGDLVLADWSGICFVPSERAEEVIEAAERVTEREAAMVQAVRSGISVVDVMTESAFQAIHR